MNAFVAIVLFCVVVSSAGSALSGISSTDMEVTFEALLAFVPQAVSASVAISTIDK